MKRSIRRNISALSAADCAGVPVCKLQSDLAQTTPGVRNQLPENFLGNFGLQFLLEVLYRATLRADDGRENAMTQILGRKSFAVLLTNFTDSANPKPFSLVQAQDADDGTRMTARQLRDEVMTIYMAGHETTAVALSWAWYLLGQHPEADARLAEEVRDVLGGRRPAVADLPRLPYAEMVMMESMRLYPPAYGLGRQATIPSEIAGRRVARGDIFIAPTWVVQRDRRWFDEPDAFPVLFDMRRRKGGRTPAGMSGAFVPLPVAGGNAHQYRPVSLQSVETSQSYEPPKYSTGARYND